MRNLKYYLAAALLSVSAASFAQNAIVGQKPQKSGGGILTNEATSYTRVSANYLTGREHMKVTGIADADEIEHKYNSSLKNFNGFRISGVEGIHLTDAVPLFLEVGMNIDFGTRKVEAQEMGSYEGIKASVNMHDTDYFLATSIPINITYKFIFKSGFYLQPYGGMSIHFNAYGYTKRNTTYTLEILGESKSIDEDESFNWYNERDMVEQGGKKRRFQVGGQVGLNIGYKMINVGVGYQWNSPLLSMTEDEKKTKCTTQFLNVGVGVNF